MIKKILFSVLTFALLLPIHTAAFTGEAVALDKNSALFILCEAPIAAGNGPWVAFPMSYEVVNFAVVPLDRKNAAIGIVDVTTNVVIQGIDMLVVPASTATGHVVATITSGISSVSNNGFTYRYYRCVSAAAQPATTSIGVKGVSDR
jgi:hypothetical protein